MKHLPIIVLTLTVAVASPLAAQFIDPNDRPAPTNRVDGQSDVAPSLSAYGAFDVGVRQFTFTNPGQLDIAFRNADGSLPAETPIYNRELDVEVWYPAVAGSEGDRSFDTLIRDGRTTATLTGQAIRGAQAAEVADLPLVLLSHGYPGNRFLMAHFAENLASKGYVVASIDHTDSTYKNHPTAFDPVRFESTLVNRSFDQLFVLNEMARLNEDTSQGLAGRIDADNTALIGYSMGGYGAIITAGGGLSPDVAGSFFAPQGFVSVHEQGSDTHNALPDPRIKTAVAIGPFGQNFGFWGDDGLAGIEIPMLFFAGSNDGTSGYANGIRAIWEGATSVDRTLITFEGGDHNTVAPIPAPAEAFEVGREDHYIDDIWDTVFMNNVGQHFVTAWFDLLLKGDGTKSAYLDLGTVGTVAAPLVDIPYGDAQTAWFGFQPGTVEGIAFETLLATTAPAPVPLPGAVWMLGLALGGLGGLRAMRRARDKTRA